MNNAPQQLEQHHVHHSYIWLGGIQVGATILFIAFISSFSAIMKALASGDRMSSFELAMIVGVGLVAFLVILAIAMLISWLSYKYLYYELGPEEFNRYSGIFNKKRVHVPYQRIQSVDQKATLLQRVFGVCTVHIDTAGGSANKAVTIPYVQKSEAERLRTELFMRKQLATAVQSGTVSPETAAALSATGALAGNPAYGFPGGAEGMSPAGAMPPAYPVEGQVPVAAPVYAGVARAQVPHNVLDAPAEVWDEVRGVFGGAAVDTGKVTYEYGLSNKELLLTGLSSNVTSVLVVVGVIASVLQFAGDFAPLFAGRFDPVVGQVTAMSSQLFGGNLIGMAVAGIFGLVLIVWLFSVIGTFISYGGFRACRRDNRIEVERGLLQHQFQGVSVDRVQSIIVKQSFIRRVFGYCELSVGKIDAATEGSENQQASLSAGMVVHPFVKMNKVPAILAELIPEFSDVPVESTSVAPVALRRALIRRGIIQGSGFWLAVAFVITQICVNLFALQDAGGFDLRALVNTWAVVGYALCVALFVLDLVGAVLWFRGSSFAYNERFMQISNGGFSRETVSFPRNKIQYGFNKTNPFQRNAGTATVHARTAAGVGGTTVHLVDVSEKDAGAWLEWLKPHGSKTQ